MDATKLTNLNKAATLLRRMMVETVGNFGVGHVGGASSVIEVLTTLYFDKAYVNPKNPKDPNRDRIVLSKGHAGPALYATLALKGFFDKDLLKTLNQPGTTLPSHCDMNKTPGIDMSTGSLGQGLSAAVGMAIAAKLDKKSYKTYCIIGDGESQEGQIWEAAMFAGNSRLNNLVLFLDNNKFQIDGATNDINSLEPIVDKWRAFNFNVFTVDGHKIEQISAAIDAANSAKNGRPSMIVLNTVKGKGLGDLEGKLASHSVTFAGENWRDYVNNIR